MRRTSYALLLAAMYGCADEPKLVQPLDSVQSHAAWMPNPAYELVKLRSSLGGAISLGTSINNRGWVAGFSDRSDGTRHAALWRDGSIDELGTLGGANSAVQWPGLNNTGLVVGISQTATSDTLGEDWSCAAFMPQSGETCVGFLWKNDVITPLPTLGGDNGFATGVNNRGQVVGWTETTVRDPTCTAPQVLQFRAVLWEPKKGRLQELPPLPRDSASAATAINERGQVVGISGSCDVAIGRYSARASVLWEKGTATEIPNLGGEVWHTPMAINAWGQVVGFSNPPGVVGGVFLPRPFIWSKWAGIDSLDLLPGDTFGQAFGINAWGQVVGRSCKVGDDGTVCLAVLWQRGAAMNLNDIVPLEDGDTLRSARDINDAGQITGDVLEASTGTVMPFIAIPNWWKWRKR